jgi:hypothetical protein
MTRSVMEETELQVADSKAAQERLASLRQMIDELRRPPAWAASTDLTAAVRARAAAPIEPARHRARWFAGGALVAAAAAGLIAFVAIDREEPGIRVKGGAADPDRWVGVKLHTGSGAPVGGSVPRGELRVSYTNLGPEPYSHLMVFAVDAAGEVRWFYPAWTDPAADPVAIAIEPGAAETALPDLIEHQLAPGRLVLCGLFLRRAVSVTEVEAAIDGLALPAARIPLAGAGQHCSEKVVR